MGTRSSSIKTTSSANPAASIHSLPNEILHAILKHFDGPTFGDVDTAIFKAMKVCKLWRLVAIDILFNIKTSRIERAATWELLVHRIRWLRQRCRSHHLNQGDEDDDGDDDEASRARAAEKRERNTSEKDKLVVETKELVEMEGIDHILLGPGHYDGCDTIWPQTAREHMQPLHEMRRLQVDGQMN